jgi:hypothetical protein
LALISVLLALAAVEVLGAMFYLVMKAYKSRLLRQGLLSYEPQPLPAAAG